MNQKPQQLVFEITPTQLGRAGINCEVPLHVPVNDLPACIEIDPHLAAQQIMDRDFGQARVAAKNYQDVISSLTAKLVACAVRTDNPALFLSKQLEECGLPEGELKEAVQARAYLQYQPLKQLLIGAVTAKQINGQVKGNPEARRVIEQLKLIDGRPLRRSAQPVASFEDLTSKAPTPALSGRDLEGRVAMALEAAGLEFDPFRRRTGTLKLFAEQAEVDFRVTTGIDDPTGAWADGFIVECKNRTSDRTPDQDLLYALYNITRFYSHPTIVVLETNNERVWQGARRFLEVERKIKKAGQLQAILSFGQFQQWCVNYTGSVA